VKAENSKKVEKQYLQSKKFTHHPYRKIISSFQTFGINGESISTKPYVCNGEIKGMMMKERTCKLANKAVFQSQKDANIDQSKKIFERHMDDKIFFFDSKDAYIMNCIDFEEILHIPTEEDSGMFFVAKL
jgi:hypothetical protein